MRFLRRLYYRIYWLFNERPIYIERPLRWVKLQGGPMDGQLKEVRTSRLCFFQRKEDTGIDYELEEQEYREDPEHKGIFVYQEKIIP